MLSVQIFYSSLRIFEREETCSWVLWIWMDLIICSLVDWLVYFYCSFSWKSACLRDTWLQSVKIVQLNNLITLSACHYLLQCTPSCSHATAFFVQIGFFFFRRESSRFDVLILRFLNGLVLAFLSFRCLWILWSSDMSPSFFLPYLPCGSLRDLAMLVHKFPFRRRRKMVFNCSSHLFW